MSRLRRFFDVYVVPGCAMQSVVIGGGYGTGREIVEYFTRYGFWGGLFAIILATVCMGAVLAVAFEFSRLYKRYDYRTFIKELLGPAWVLFELATGVMLLLILSVLTAAAAQITVDALHLPRAVGLFGMAGLIGLLTFFGRGLLKFVMTFWSFVLYAVFLTFLILVIPKGGDAIAASAADGVLAQGWFVSGLKYAFYNLSVAPLILFVVRPFEHRREAVTSGALAAVITMAPAAIFHIAFLAAFPAIIDQAVPVYWMIGNLNAPVFLVVYSIMLFGAFVRSGAGSLQGLLERVAVFCEEKGWAAPSPTTKLGLALAAILGSAMLGNLGVVALVAKGYGLMAWVYLAVFVAPLMTWGVFKIFRGSRQGRIGDSEVANGSTL